MREHGRGWHHARACLAHAPAHTVHAIHANRARQDDHYGKSGRVSLHTSAVTVPATLFTHATQMPAEQRSPVAPPEAALLVSWVREDAKCELKFYMRQLLKSMQRSHG